MSEFTVLHSVQEWQAKFGSSARSVVSVGNFDGLHLGHQRILREVVQRARSVGAIAAAVTFHPHPLKVLRPAQAPPLVETLEQRMASLASMGLDAAVVLHFDKAFAALTAQEFVRGILVDGLHAGAVLVGQTFRFGHKQAGDVTLLTEMGRECSFDVEIVPPVTMDGWIVSSTAVRRAVQEGRAADAARLLGRPFALSGPIERGAGRGSTVLVPTLNLAPEQELMPKTGVYATEVRVGGRTYEAATNVGYRPTFGGVRLSVESHLFDFNEQLVDGRMEVRFRERLRDELKFSSAQELLKQIQADLERAREFFRLRAAEQAQQHA